MMIRILSSATLLLVCALIALSVSFGCGSKQNAAPKSATTTEKTTTYGKAVEKAKEVTAALSNPEKGIDPVCGMTLDDNMVVIEVDGKKYGFCSASCAERFKADPGKYLGAEQETN